MSSYLSDFVGRVWNLFKKGNRNRTSTPVCPAPLRRCNSVILDSRLKEAISSRTADCEGFWKTPKWNPEPLPHGRPVSSREFHSTPPERKKECSSCKGDMNDLQHVLAFREKQIPIRGRKAERGDGYALRRSRSFDSKDSFLVFNRNVDSWHQKFHSLRSQDALENSEISLNHGKEGARRQKSIYTVVDLSRNKQGRKRSKSKIPVLTRDSRLCTKEEDIQVRNCLEDVATPTTMSTSSHQMARCSIARRSRLDLAFDRLFWRHCDSKYRGNIIDCPSHVRWMREAGLELDTDGNRFRNLARGKVTLNLNEYKCAVKKMCDEAGSDYWEVLDRMTSCHEGDFTLTAPSKKISM